jgi:antitoxin component YwqK of YwqJK toxin-antitoxin module
MMSDEQQYKNLSAEELEKKLAEQLNKFTNIVNRMDSSAEGEATAALLKARKIMGNINEIAEILTGENPGLSFAEILKKADAYGGGQTDSAGLEELKKQNVELIAANENFRIAEEIYKKKLENIDAYIDESIKENDKKNTILLAQMSAKNLNLQKQIDELQSAEGIYDLIAKDNHILKIIYDTQFHVSKIVHYDRVLKKPIVTISYKDGFRSGPYKRYHGAYLIEEGNFEHDKKHGKWKHYDDAGNLSMLETYSNDQRDGLYQRYEGSILKEQGFYKNDKKQGEWKHYDRAGKLSVLKTYNNGEKHGLYQRYEGSILKKQGNFVHDEKHGEWRHYDDAGNLSILETYSNDKKHGLYQRYEGSILKEQGFYKKNKKDGEWKYYDDAGNLSILETYSNSEEYRFYQQYEGSIIKKQGFFDNGKKDGEWKYYDRAGNLSILETYSSGKKYGLYQRYESSKLKEQGFFDNDKKKGEWKYYDRAGDLSILETYSNDKKHGLYQRYESSKLKEHGFFDNDKKQGEWKHYDHAGKLSTLETYSSGKKHGLYQRYESSKLKEHGFFDNDKKQGVWKYYDDQGQINKYINFYNGTWDSVHNEKTEYEDITVKYINQNLVSKRFTVYSDSKKSQPKHIKIIGYNNDYRRPTVSSELLFQFDDNKKLLNRHSFWEWGLVVMGDNIKELFDPNKRNRTPVQRAHDQLHVMKYF